MEHLFALIHSKHAVFIGASYLIAFSSLNFIAYLVYKQKRLTQLFFKQLYEQKTEK